MRLYPISKSADNKRPSRKVLIEGNSAVYTAITNNGIYLAANQAVIVGVTSRNNSGNGIGVGADGNIISNNNCSNNLRNGIVQSTTTKLAYTTRLRHINNITSKLSK